MRWTRYEWELAKRAGVRSREHIKLECGVVTASSVVTGLAAWDATGFFWAGAVSSFVGGLVVVLAIFLLHLLPEPWRLHGEQGSMIGSLEADYSKRHALADALRAKQSAINRIDPSKTTYEKAMRHLQTEQKGVIYILRESDEWQHKPDGFGGDEVWVDWLHIANLMVYKYRGQICDPNDLYDYSAPGKPSAILSPAPSQIVELRITPENFQMAQGHAATLVGLIIREIENPGSTPPNPDTPYYRIPEEEPWRL